MGEPIPVGTLTAEAAGKLTVLAVLKLVGERLWLATTRLHGAAAQLQASACHLAAVSAGKQLTEVDGALSDVLTALRAIYATILRTEANDAHVGVVMVEDAAWLWREQVRGVLLDFSALPKSAPDLVEDLTFLARTIRLNARAFTSVAQRAPAAPRQLQLVEVARVEPGRCADCGAAVHDGMTPPLCDLCLFTPAPRAEAEARQAVLAEDWSFGGWVKGKGWRAYLQHVTDPATTWEVFGRTRSELVEAIRARRLAPEAPHA